MNNNADEIISNLWLGNELAAGDDDFIKLNNIEKIVNISPDIPNYFYNIHYLRIPITNRLKYQSLFKSYLDYSYFFIDTAVSRNKSVMIHSKNNSNLDTLLLIFYLMKKFNWTYGKSLSKITGIRQIYFKEPLYLKNVIIT